MKKYLGFRNKIENYQNQTKINKPSTKGEIVETVSDAYLLILIIQSKILITLIKDFVKNSRSKSTQKVNVIFQGQTL